MKEQNKEKRKEELLQWHSAFYAGLQIEFAEEFFVLTTLWSTKARKII